MKHELGTCLECWENNNWQPIDETPPYATRYHDHFKRIPEREFYLCPKCGNMWEWTYPQFREIPDGDEINRSILAAHDALSEHGDIEEWEVCIEPITQEQAYFLGVGE